MHSTAKSRKSRIFAKSIVKNVALLATVFSLAHAENEEPPLLGLRHRNETWFAPLSKVSMVGGLEMFVDGRGMDAEPHINHVLFIPTQDDPIELAGPKLNIDDEIQSAPDLGRLAYTLPAITDILGGVSMETFNTHFIANDDENIEFQLKISNQAEATNSACPEDQEHLCHVRYSMRYTPHLHDISPSNVYLDQQLSILLNPMAANEDTCIRDDMDPVVFIKFSGTRCDSEGLIDNETRLTSYTVGSLKTKAGDQHPGAQDPEVRFRVGNAYKRETAKHCNFAGDDCWYVKTHPKIDSISMEEGYVTGGQTLTIDGWGLKGATGMHDISVTVDGVPCTITEHGLEQVKCVTGAADEVSVTDVSQPGSPGLTQDVMDSENEDENPYWAMRHNGEVPIVETKLQTAFENSYSNYTRAGTNSKGWFRAPATGNYRFYIACDDACQLFIDETNKWDRSAPVEPDAQQIAIRHSATGWRNYLLEPEPESSSQYRSDWIALEEGEFYKIEGFMMEYTGSDHYTVSVEFEATKEETAGHHHAGKEVQILEINPENVQEKFNITVEGADGSQFKIKFLNPKHDPSNKRSVQLWESGWITDTGNIWHYRQQFVRYFYNIWGSNVQVEQTRFDADDVETTDSDLTVKSVYTVTVLRQISGASFTMASIMLDEAATSTITIGAAYQTSTAPMEGNFVIVCPNEDGSEFSTRELGRYTEAKHIDFYVQLEIPHLQFKTYIRDTGKYTYRDNGISLQMVFTDYHGDVPQCEIRSGTTTPLEATNVSFDSSTIREYGDNLMFEPIPLEFLYADAQKPQVLVTVNGIDGVCPEFNCDYAYFEPTGVITGQTLTNGVDLVITGTNLPTENVAVRFANSECVYITASETEISCSLTMMPAAGAWSVRVYDVNGLIPVDEAVVALDVALVIDSCSPNTQLNQLGGDILTLTGTGFDPDYTNSAIVFSEDGTSCDIFFASATSVKCVVFGFNADTLDTSTPYTVSMTVNEVVNSDQTVMVLSTKQSGQTVSPNSVSPVLASVLTVTLESTYPEILNSRDEFTAILISRDDPDFTRPLFVMSVDDSNKSLQIKFPGADSGNYNIFLVGEGVGRIDKEPLALTVTSQVTSISPLTGSVLGGTMVTIQGINFSDDALDNPVTVGGYWCFVQTSSPTEITCRIMETYAEEISSVQVLTFLRTSEEAVNLCSNVFEYAEPIASVTAMTNAFETTTNTQVITLEGTGFGTDTSTIELYIDGVQQECLTADETTATFTIDGMLDEVSENIQLYFADGLPTGYADVSSVTVSPSLVSVSPSSGSFGGTLITVTGTGFGVDTQDVNLIHETSGTEICSEVEMISYGTFTCLTVSLEISSADNLYLKTASGSYSCANSLNSAECHFEQAQASSPSVTGATISNSSTIAIDGTDFPTSDYDVIVLFKGVESDSATINSDTSITATFNNGIPVSESADSPSIRFVPAETGDRRQLISLSDAGIQLVGWLNGDVTLQNTLSVTASTSGLSCSFQGGCSYTVTSDGLTSTLTDSETNYIDVCGNNCVIDTDASDADQTTCTLPLVQTAYSASTFDIVKEGKLHDGTWSGTASDDQLAGLVDGLNMIDMEDSTSTDCYFQIQYKENHVGVLDEVKFFVNTLIDKNPFDGNLKFQGSDDGVTFDDLWLIDAGVHEGWNTKDFDEEQPSYNIYRFQGAIAGSCRIGEVKLHGVESIDNDDESFTCTPKLNVDGVVTELNPVTYDTAFTPVLTSVSNRFASVLGGEQIEFYGTGFSSSATITIMIDNRECVIDSATSDTITCTTSDKPYRPDTPKLEIFIDGFGLVATKGQVIRYVSLWSQDQTWGYDLSPQDGEAVNIPKGLHLLFDIDVGPKLSFVNVEGSLIFPSNEDPNHHRYFDAHYILVKGGYMEIGTEEYRYTSKLTMTMHSSKFDPNLPIFGNKVIGVHYGTLEMHGLERPVTWSDLWETVEAGGTSIILNYNGTLDWAAGEDIVIASTDFSGRNAEQRTIETIDYSGERPVITFTEPLMFKHFGKLLTFGDDFIEMRAEVGLLTRNVVYCGDKETSDDNQYGAVIIMHSPGDETTIARIDGIELTRVGQAFILGSYPIHFHMIGTVHSSYVRNNAIHHTFNRAVTIHGVHYLRVQNNVAYHTMGHTIFIEDAAETKNLIEFNCIIDVRRSWSLLNTDQSPASIWITNPNNIIRNNRAGGSDRYSYWYDLQITAIGPSFDANICPENVKLGEFRDNVAHSNGRYGLRIFHNHLPRTFPCKPMGPYDPTNPDNPYPENPIIPAEYHNLVSYKNRRDGAIVERAGAIQWHGFKTADNGEVGMEFSTVKETADGFAMIKDGVVIGRTENTELILDRLSPVGIKNPRTENFQIHNVRFYNYNWNHAAGMGTCSHCWHDNNTDSGARTITVWDLFFDSTVQLYVDWTTPWRTIFHDKTGGLTGKGPDTWLAPEWNHLLQPECSMDELVGGITCDSTVQIRRIALSGMPTNFFGMRLKIAQLDRADENAMKADGTLDEYLESNSNYSIVPYKDKGDPMNGWAMPYVTGHRYRLHWESGLDFESMYVQASERWEADDEYIFMVFNFTASREAVNFTSSGNEQNANNSLIEKTTTDLVTGDNWVRNDTDIRTFEFVVNGKDESYSNMNVEPLECILGVCELEAIEEVELEEGQRLWSDPESWGGTLPVEGDNVEVQSGWNMILDLEETPYLKSLTINGRLSFLDFQEQPIHLKAESIFVRAGEFYIGSAEKPFKNKATISLMGEQEAETLRLSGTVDGSNKVMAVTGKVEFYGESRGVNMARLLVPCKTGDTEIYVEGDPGWSIGDDIYLAPTAMQNHHSEYRQITDILGSKITLNEPLTYYHYGEGASTADEFNGIDMRGEVLLLSRNIRIEGEDKDGWGGQVLGTDMFESDGTWRKGQIIMDQVQVYNCSQKDTYYGAIRFEGHIAGHSRISNSAVHNGLGMGVVILNGNNVELVNNAFVGFRQVGMMLDFVRNCTITGNFIGDVFDRGIQFIDMTIDKEACVAYSSYEVNDKGSPSYDMTFTDNIAAGCPYAGFIAPGHECGDTSQVNFRNNVAHSIAGYGGYLYKNPADSGASKCFEVSHFAAYKVADACVVTFAQTLDHRASHMTCIDNEIGMSLNTSEQEADEIYITLSDSFFAGETRSLDCPDNSNCYCEPKFAMMNFANMNDPKPLMPTMASSLPIYVSHGEGNWGGTILIEDSKFQGFAGKQKCGQRHVLFERNPMGSDKIPPHTFKNCKFHDVNDDGMAWLEKPDLAWANIKDCGNFPCTAPNNLIYTFLGSRFTGITPTTTTSDMTLVPDDETVAGTYPGCDHKPGSQAYICQTKRVGMLMFENLDDDGWDRAIQPVTITNEKSGFKNVLNAMMDHIWDTFYTGQRRMPRFPAAIMTDQDYTLEFAGTPPKKLRFHLDARAGATKIKIPYPVSGSIQVYADGKKKSYTPWNEELNRNGPLTKTKGCGENRFVGIENFLEFYITPGCEITIEPKDAIMTKVRMNWSLAEFYSDGGTTRFVDRLAASLGIAANRIKTVAIYEGSVVVDFVIEADEDESPAQAIASLAAIETQLVTQVEAGDLNIGAPIMGLEGGDGKLLAGDPIPAAPTTVTNEDGTITTVTTTTTEVFTGEGNSAIVGDTNLWDGLEDTAPEPEPVVEEPEPVVEPTPEPEPVVEEPEPVVEPIPEPEPVVEEPEPVVEPTPEPVVEPTPEPQPVVEPTPRPQPVVEPTPQPTPTPTPTPERETIIVTKIIEVFVEEEVEFEDTQTTVVAEAEVKEEKLTVEQKKEDDSRVLMIVIPAAIVGLLLIVACVMLVRVFTSKKNLPPIVIEKVKTDIHEDDVEPQFVMANDDTKNIFARPSTAPMNVGDAIEGSDAKKDSDIPTSRTKKRPKKIILRKKTTSSGNDQSDFSSLGQPDEEANDDGFLNHTSGLSPDHSRTSSFNDSSRKFFRPESKGSVMSPTSISTAAKLKSIMLHKVDEE